MADEKRWTKEELLKAASELASPQGTNASSAVAMLRQAASDAEALERLQAGGVKLVVDELAKQRAKGYDAAHDDTHMDGAIAGAAYSLLFYHVQGDGCNDLDDPENWIDELVAANRGESIEQQRKRLVIAAALCVAEIERLGRLQPPSGGKA